ncbi:MAG: hypothetical protein H0W08_01975 [Acidobacteria bacterium]|nr:hypothetical protein [Acidobacteriota bacterium]
MSRVAVLLAALMVVAAGSDLSMLAGTSAQQPAGFVCPMHPDVLSAVPGSCSSCGMTLIPVHSGSTPAYAMELPTGMDEVVAGRPFTLALVVREPETGAIVHRFVEVHERRFHLFVIGEDLEFYTHLHPGQRDDGSWSLDVTLPRPGRYKVYADFRPDGGPPQVLARALVTAGFTDDPAAPRIKLAPDRELYRTAGSMSVVLDLPARGPAAGPEQNFSYRITDVATGAPVTDLEPYLGAWGHSLLLSEDMSQFVHAHPVESLSAGRGGPALTFKAALPTSGTYRIWTQLKRRGEVSTAVFTVHVTSKPGK